MAVQSAAFTLGVVQTASYCDNLYQYTGAIPAYQRT